MGTIKKKWRRDLVYFIVILLKPQGNIELIVQYIKYIHISHSLPIANLYHISLKG